jgi:hypothetical protein
MVGWVVGQVIQNCEQVIDERYAAPSARLVELKEIDESAASSDRNQNQLSPPRSIQVSTLALAFTTSRPHDIPPSSYISSSSFCNTISDNACSNGANRTVLDELGGWRVGLKSSCKVAPIELA